ncbi:MAG: metallophosphoesterase [Clostridia bacterium]|nr:metallophosphoesterase [Clostridia bacterium]
MKLKMIILITIAIFAIVIIYISTMWIEVSKKEIITDQLPESIEALKIIHLADLHGKDLGQNNKKIIDTINKEQPDFIVLTGDMINSTDDDGHATVALLQNLNNRYPVYYAYGNHDLYCRLHTPDVFSAYINKVAETGCFILDDEMLSFEKNGESIGIYGLSSIPYRKKVRKNKVRKDQFTAQFIETKIGSASKERFDILLAHDPTWFQEYSDWKADLILSGHIHGGAIRLPFLGGVISPNRTLFPKYDSGIYHNNDSILYVSRGLGTSVERIRIFNRPEIAVIVVKPSN